MNAEGRWLAEKWADQLGPAISAMTGTDARAKRVDSRGPSGSNAKDLWWFQPTDVAPGAVIWLVISEAVWKDIGRKVLEAAGLDDADEAETRGTFLEILQQSLAPLGTAIGARLQREIHLAGGEIQQDLPDALEWHAVEVIARNGILGKAWMCGAAPLLAALEPPVESEPARDDPAAEKVRKSSPTLELLMEVELPVGVSFGRAQMRLKDAVKLTTGSIVELNRSITEPVEVVVNNCVIARGEVVVVEGNYGVRIKQIISREERLRTLF
jgi:flagellar motor switch protein FliN/FliY